MKTLKSKITVAMTFLFALPFVAMAAEMDHSKMDHSKMGHGMSGPKVAMTKAVKKGRLDRLSKMPPSGQAREAGSDGRYAMEPTSVRTRRSEKCAQATRGLIMLDNSAWKRCGGKPEGAPKSVKDAPDGKVDHSKMNH